MRISLVYVGDRLNSKKQRIQEWLECDGLDNTGERFPYSDKRQRWYKRLHKSAFVGEIYSYEIPTDDPDWEKKRLISPNTVQRAGTWQNEQDRLDWRAWDIATSAELAARKKSKQDDLLEKLRPFRLAYQQLGTLQRAQFLAKIVHFVTH